MKPFVLVLLAVMLLLQACTSKPEEKIDHIILAVSSLEAGMKQFEYATGVRPVFGGIHPNSFTQNALVALDNKTYIEILAPRDDSVDIPEWILKCDKLTPMGWAIRSEKIKETRAKVLALGFAASTPSAGSRARPDGSLLSWTSFGIDDRRFSVFPFFIQWGEGTIHPSASSPKGCELIAMKIFSPDSKPIIKLVESLKLVPSVAQFRTDSVSLELNTPKGRVTFPKK